MDIFKIRDTWHSNPTQLIDCAVRDYKAATRRLYSTQGLLRPAPRDAAEKLKLYRQIQGNLTGMEDSQLPQFAPLLLLLIQAVIAAIEAWLSKAT